MKNLYGMRLVIVFAKLMEQNEAYVKKDWNIDLYRIKCST